MTAEINSLEARLVKAEITGDEEEKQKVSMMISSLRSRRGSLIEEAKAVREEEARAASAGPAGAVDAATIMRIDALEADNRALRNQIADVRGGLQDVKEQLRQIMHALGIEEDD